MLCCFALNAPFSVVLFCAFIVLVCAFVRFEKPRSKNKIVKQNKCFIYFSGEAATAVGLASNFSKYHYSFVYRRFLPSYCLSLIIKAQDIEAV